MTALQENIKKLRIATAYRQETFAKEIDVPRVNVAAWEEGRANPRLPVIQKILDKFEIPKDLCYSFLFEKGLTFSRSKIEIGKIILIKVK